ncbi:MAG: transcriptional regulator [Defluviitaleaceae bacterium]|nr:transcriptional regulator [Defluviitaleaceae bacterium]
MESVLKQQLVEMLGRLERISLPEFCADVDLTTLGFMRSIAHNFAGGDDNVYMADLPGRLHVSKASISQIASLLESKGYVEREINKTNRRQITITLTNAGQEALSKAEGDFNKLLDDFLDRLGDDDAKEALRLFQRFAEIMEQISITGGN